MFIRWKQSRPTGYDVTRYTAYLVLSIRIEGKPRQKQYYIAAYSVYDIESLRYQRKSARDVQGRINLFLQHASKRLQEANLTPDEHSIFAEKLNRSAYDLFSRHYAMEQAQ